MTKKASVSSHSPVRKEPFHVAQAVGTGISKHFVAYILRKTLRRGRLRYKGTSTYKVFHDDAPAPRREGDKNAVSCSVSCSSAFCACADYCMRGFQIRGPFLSSLENKDSDVLGSAKAELCFWKELATCYFGLHYSLLVWHDGVNSHCAGFC